MKGECRMKKNKGLLLITILVFSFLFVPLILILITSFTSGDYVAFPPVGFSLKWYTKVFNTQSFVDAFKLSIQISTAATVLSLIVGIPGAYAMSRFNFKGKGFMKTFFFSPNIIPQVVMGFALFQFIIIKMGLSVTIGLLVGLTVSIITYALRIIGASIEGLDYSIEEAAMILGANKVKTFFIIVLPNISSGILSAFLLAFISAFNNVPVTIFLSGPGITTLPVAMMNYVEYNYDPTVSALSVMMMAMSMFIMLLMEKVLKVKTVS